ncbi:MAG: ThiF family adenylyltransferase [Candidatus Omnitrophica bacterium]|nr:ThiF family adenylyltransferase [Candidatus Omnitrophota bacterium]
MEKFSHYERQCILREIGREGQRRLDESQVAVIGLGTSGLLSAYLLARAGIGDLLLIDRDYAPSHNGRPVEPWDQENLERDLPKAVAAEKKIARANSEIRVHAEIEDLNVRTIDRLLKNTNLIIDGTDNFETRYLFNDYALKKKIPWIYGGAVGMEGMSYVISPGRGPCFRCLFGQAPNLIAVQTCDQAGVAAPVAHLIASFQATEAIKILADRWEIVERQLWKVDVWNRQFQSISVRHLKSSPCSGCRDRDYPYLDPRMSMAAVSLCGRNEVQLDPQQEKAIDLDILRRNLNGDIQILYNDYFLRLRTGPYEIAVFKNGRILVRGTEDIIQARALCNRYIGER